MNDGWMRRVLLAIAGLGATALGLLMWVCAAGIVAHGARWGWFFVAPAVGCLAIALMVVNHLPRNQR